MGEKSQIKSGESLNSLQIKSVVNCALEAGSPHIYCLSSAFSMSVSLTSVTGLPYPLHPKTSVKHFHKSDFDVTLF